jgi:hypothetical protein
LAVWPSLEVPVWLGVAPLTGAADGIVGTSIEGIELQANVSRSGCGTAVSNAPNRAQGGAGDRRGRWPTPRLSTGGREKSAGTQEHGRSEEALGKERTGTHLRYNAWQRAV